MVKNTIACYVYVFGMETDGSSYVLFPYPTKEDPSKTKFSPYCGITGYRLFPKGMSLQADELGNKDYMAVVVSKEPLDVFAINNAINQQKGSNYAASVDAALRSKLIKNVQFSSTAKGTISFTTTANENNMVATVVEMDKQ